MTMLARWRFRDLADAARTIGRATGACPIGSRRAGTRRQGSGSTPAPRPRACAQAASLQALIVVDRVPELLVANGVVQEEALGEVAIRVVAERMIVARGAA